MADLTYNVRVNTSDAQRSISTLKTALGGLAAAFSIREIVRFADSVQSLRNRLLTLTPSVDAVNKQFQAIAQIARDSRTPLEQTGDLFFRIARSAQQLGISQREAAVITDTLAKGLSASGLSAQEAAGPLLQLGQALQSGRFQGDELRSILEGMPIVAKALADELGVPIGQLKQLGSEGKITADVFVRAMRSSRDAINEAFGRTVPTIGQAFETIRTNVSVFFEEFERNTGLFTAFAEGIAEVGRGINTVGKFIADNIEGFKTLTKIIAGVLVAYLTLGRGIGTINSVANGVAAAFSRTGGVMIGLTGAVKGVSAAFTAFFLNLARGVGIMKTAYGGITSLAFAVTALSRALLRLAGIAAVFYAIAQGVDFLTKKFFDFSIVDSITEKLKEFGEWIGILGDKQEEAAGPAEDFIGQLSDTVEGQQQAIKITQEQINAIQDLISAYDQINQKQLESLRIQGEQIGMSESQKTLANELRTVYENYADQRQKLEKEIRDATAKGTEEELLRVPLLQKELDNLSKKRDDQSEAVRRQVEANEQLLRAYNLSEFALKQQQQLEDDLAKIQLERAKLGMSEIEKKYADISAAADASARAAIRAEEARRGEKLSPQEVEQYYKAARKGAEDLKRANEELYRQSRTFASGWEKAFREYVDDATNAARQAERLFQKLTSGLEDLIVNFVKTGKFEFKDFIASMAEEILRSNIRSLFAGIFTSMNDAVANQESGIMGTIGKLLGFTGGSGGAARGQSASTPMYVYDVSGGGGGGAFGGVRPGYLPGDNPLIAGGGIGGGSQGGGFFGSLGNIASGIGNVFGGVAKSVGNVIGGITNTVGSIARTVGNIFTGGGSSSGGSFLGSVAKGIGDLFGGWFATGGTIPAGRFGIVGERGPEYVSGPATVTPMMGTNVTYNINAVDAASFKALIARDPAFIHSVAMMGAQTVPGRR